MCCWGYEDVYLEDAPSKKKKPEEDKNEYILMSSDLPKPAEAPVEAPHEAPQAAPPKSGWERLAEAQDEAKRNAQVEPLNPALAQAAAQPATEPFQMGPFIPSAPEPTLAVGPFGYYYYYSQPAYVPPPTMHYVAQPHAFVGHHMMYQPAPAPAKVEEKKADPGPSPYGDPNTEFYCRELDGVWSLRTCTDIMKNCQPGFWQKNEVSGWPVFYRQKP